MESPELQPGLSVDVVVKQDETNQFVDVRSSIIYDVTGSRIVMAQTVPPLAKSHTGKLLVCTFLHGKGQEMERFGLACTLDAIDQYTLSHGLGVTALFLSATGRLDSYNLRMFFRVEPPSGMVSAMVNNEEVNLLDVSLGGMRISYFEKGKFECGSTVKVTLGIEGSSELRLHGSVLRTWEKDEAEDRRSDLEFAAIGFTDTSEQERDLLAKSILEIQRKLRFREMFR